MGIRKSISGIFEDRIKIIWEVPSAAILLFCNSKYGLFSPDFRSHSNIRLFANWFYQFNSGHNWISDPRRSTCLKFHFLTEMKIINLAKQRFRGCHYIIISLAYARHKAIFFGGNAGAN